MGTKAGRGVVLACILGAGMAWMDALMINVILPVMDRDLGLGVSGLQWTVSGYLVVLSSLLLLGGAFSDRFDRRKMYLFGLGLFAAASVLCGMAQSSEMLIVARLLQGVSGAVMVPASLAIVQVMFASSEHGKAVGAWTGIGAVFTAIGPLVGGAFATYATWRWAFFINVPIAVLTALLVFRFIPSLEDAGAIKKMDYLGAVLVTAGFALLTFGAIDMQVWAGLFGLVLLGLFLIAEHRSQDPLLPLHFLKNREFTSVNLASFLFYGAFATAQTLLGVRLQEGMGYSAFLAGLATLPVNVLMLMFSSRFGSIATRTGAKWPMTIGPLLVAGALGATVFISDGIGYWPYIFPTMVVWGLGMAICIAPLTSAALDAVEQEHAGVASGVNNAATRAGQAFAIALIPTLAGMGASGGSLGGPNFDEGYAAALWISTVLCAIPGFIALIFVRGRKPQKADI